MKKLFGLFMVGLAVFAFCGSGYAQDSQKKLLMAKLRAESDLQTFTQKWMAHKNTDVCLPEEIGSDGVVVHRNSWDVVTRFLMYYDITADAQGQWQSTKNLYSGDRFADKKEHLIQWNTETVDILLSKFAQYYYKEYVQRPTNAKGARVESTGPTRADDRDYPWTLAQAQIAGFDVSRADGIAKAKAAGYKTNAELSKEFSDDLENLRKALSNYDDAIAKVKSAPEISPKRIPVPEVPF